MPAFVEDQHPSGETGHQQNLELRALYSHLRGQIDAGHSGHVEIGQEKIDIVLILSRKRGGFHSVGSGKYFVRLAGQQGTDDM